VEEIGRKFYLVKSNTREDLCHVVDLEQNVFGTSPACSCETARYRKSRCKHIQAVERFVAAQNGSQFQARKNIPQKAEIFVDTIPSKV
jgi:hypothetical protein